MKSKLIGKMIGGVKYVGKKAKQHSSEICLVGSIVAGGAMVFTACKSTLKVEELMAKQKEGLDAVEEYLGHESDEYTQEDARKDKVTIYARTVVGLGKLYFKPMVFGAASLTLMLFAFKKVKKQNAILAASLSASYEAFNAYRGRVKERYGDEIENAIFYNLKEEEFEETVVDEKGKEKTVKNKKLMYDAENNNAIVFDETTSKYYENDFNLNVDMLKRAEDAFNTEAHSMPSFGRKVVIFENDVRKTLGMAPTKEGQIRGWAFDPYSDEEKQIDFGIQKANVRSDDYAQGYKEVILLNFNIDGYVADQL